MASAAGAALDTLPGTGRAQQAALNNIVRGARVVCRCAALSLRRRAQENATQLCTLHNTKNSARRNALPAMTASSARNARNPGGGARVLRAMRVVVATHVGAP
jgi:hypothetical protein